MNAKKHILFAMILVLTLAAAGCGHTENYGESISGSNITPIKDILANLAQYADKDVTIRGKIVLECETGCWFNLKDGDAVIYTDLAPGGFAIPQNVGRSAVVEGKVMIKDGRTTLVARGARLQ